jgi:hypothetical protein
MDDRKPIKIHGPDGIWKRFHAMTMSGGERAYEFLQEIMEDERIDLKIRVVCARDLVALNAALMRYEMTLGNPDGNTVRIELGETAKRLLSPAITNCDTYQPPAEQRAGMPSSVRKDDIGGESVDTECIDLH